MAHRGNSAQAPENTMAAFRRALADGADLIETDLRLTADGAFVCLHDGTLERTGGVSVPAAAVKLEELKRHPVDCGRAEFGAERVPALRELLEVLPPDVGLALELKSDSFLEPETGRRLGELLRGSGVLGRTAILSFDFARCRAVRQEVPGLRGGFITLTGSLPPAGEAEMIGFAWPLLLLNPLLPWRAHRRGLFVAPLDGTPDHLLGYYRAIGCDAVLTNDPAATLRKLGRGARQP
jgi:glycerophosphoryl diester phosphodiesterase